MLSRLLTTLAAGLILTPLYVRYQQQQDDLDAKYDISLRSPATLIEKFGKNSFEGISTRIAAKAFQDMGWDGPVYFSLMGHELGEHAFVAKDHNGIKSAFVYIPQGGNIEVHYAIMGHEAVHCLNDHQKSAYLLRGATYSASLTLAVLAFEYIKHPVPALLIAAASLTLFSSLPNALQARHFEKQADCVSSEKLGNAHVHKFHLSKGADKKFSFFQRHPPSEERVRYLSDIATKEIPYPFVESEEYKDIISVTLARRSQ
tara:strand:+ start:47 stop:823 length:777 start_codon:yes stop_codon:yes gene_type:complete